MRIVAKGKLRLVLIHIILEVEIESALESDLRSEHHKVLILIILEVEIESGIVKAFGTSESVLILIILEVEIESPLLCVCYLKLRLS